jgi:hypothetical protein
VRPRARPVGFVVGAMLIAAACGFPQVSYTSGDGGGVGKDGSLDHGQIDPDSPNTEGSSSGDDVATDGNDASFDSGYMFEAAPDAPECDMDQDGHLAEASYMGKPPQNTACVDAGGNDCDDFDSHAHPGVTAFQTWPAHPPTNGDWNCDGMVEKEFNINVSCGVLNLGACPSTQGFTGDPICGTAGSYVTCVVMDGILCVTGSTDTTTKQACR